MSESFEQEALALVTRMAALRDFSLDETEWEDPSAVYRRLVTDLRPRMDEAEGILRKAAKLRLRARNVALRAASAAGTAYDEKLEPTSRAAVRREYESIRDREVVARVAVSPQFRDQRDAEAEAARVDLAWEAVRGMYFGLREIREELLTALKFLPWEASLERT